MTHNLRSRNHPSLIHLTHVLASQNHLVQHQSELPVLHPVQEFPVLLVVLLLVEAVQDFPVPLVVLLVVEAAQDFPVPQVFDHH